LLYRPQVEFLEGRLAPAILTVLNTNDSGPGSLRQALLEAQSTPENDLVTFAAGVTGTIQLASQLPSLDSGIDLEGPGPANLTVQGNSSYGFPILQAPFAATVAGLTIAHGASGVEDYGGGMMISNCTIASNSGAGIAFFAYGNLTVSNCTIAGNSGSGIYRGYSASGLGGVMTITNSTIANNSGAAGGGIVSPIGGIIITNCTIANNTATGGVMAGGPPSVPPGFGRQPFGGNGGGINNAGPMIISNSTIAFNVAKSNTIVTGLTQLAYAPGNGGGIWNSGELTLDRCTIAENSAFGGSGGGVLSNGPGTVTVHNTLVAQNRLPPDRQPGIDPDVAGSFRSLGHNLIGDGTGGIGFTSPGDKVGTSIAPLDPRLGPLQDNGGPTQTMALRPDSPALNAADNTNAPVTDQRGLARMVGGANDIGAYEYQGPFLSPNQTWVTHVYSDLLNRAADAEGLAFWSSLLDQGASPTGVALSIVHSTEYYANEVQQLYQRYLHRAADPQGFQSAVAFLIRGQTLEQLQTALLASDEYYQHHGSNFAGFVSGLYQDTLGRQADSAEVAAWQRVLETGSARGVVAQLIGSSFEADTLLVESTYQQVLSRQADPDGQAAWVAALQQGLTEELLIACFAGSAEYVGSP
jgi:hypothetical protein